MVTFPHIGPLSLVMRQLFDYLEIPYVIPEKNGRKSLERGAAISPEEICIPFKYMAGNLISAYEKGADTAIMVATCGPCRLGEYGELLKIVLEKEGYRYGWILCQSSGAGNKGVMDNLTELLKENGVSKSRTVIGIMAALNMIRKIDVLREEAQTMAGYLSVPHEAVLVLQDVEKKLEECDSFYRCFKIIDDGRRRLKNMEHNCQVDPIKLLIVGEIYTSIEPEANDRLEERLMDMGCCVKRHINLSWWIRHSLIEKLLPEGFRAFFVPKNGIRHPVGGYGRETVAKLLKGRKYDGIIKIMPAGCMPEIVTKGFCEKPENKKEMCILHLVYDELSSDVGYETRLEAFIDMIERKRDVLVGN